ncbi:MAG: GxxExxY protein [Candidatus Sulfotelmatobacter sp.]
MNQVTGAIVSSAMKVHSELGPGLLESAYQACLAHELKRRGFAVATQVGLPVVYEGERIELGCRMDLVVENLVIVEVKCVEAVHPVHQAQLLSYMRLSGIGVGLDQLLRPSPARRHQAHGGWEGLGEVKGQAKTLPQGTQSTQGRALIYFVHSSLPSVVEPVITSVTRRPLKKTPSKPQKYLASAKICRNLTLAN